MAVDVTQQKHNKNKYRLIQWLKKIWFILIRTAFFMGTLLIIFFNQSLLYFKH